MPSKNPGWKCLFLASLLGCVPATGSQWVPVSGLVGGNAQVFLVVNDTAYVGLGSGALFRSLAGGPWAFSGKGLNSSAFHALLKSGDHLYAGVTGGVFRSTDGGASWTSINSGQNGEGNSLAREGSYLFTSGYGTSIFRKHLDSADWEKVHAGSGSHVAWKIISLGQGELLAATNGGGILASRDGGKTWTSSDNGLTSKMVYDVAAFGNSIFAGTGNGIFRSDDGGKVWVKPASQLHASARFAPSTLGGRIYAVSGSMLIHSGDNGATWTQVSNFAGGNANCLAVVGDRLLAGIYGKGVFRSAQSASPAADWSAFNAGLTGLNVRSLAVIEGKVLAGADHGVFTSADGNLASWSFAGNATTLSANAMLQAGEHLFVSDYQGITRTDDHVSWSRLDHVLAKANVHCLAAAAGRIYAGTWSGGLAYTVDQGANWTASDSGLPSAAIKSLLWGPWGMLAGTHQGTYLSADSGRTWSPAKTGLMNTQVSGLLRAGDRLLSATSGGVFRSDDSAKTWIGPGAGLNGVVWALAQWSGRVFASTGTGVFVSEDRGEAWQRLGQSWSGGGVDALALRGDTLLAGTRNQGLWLFDLSTPATVRTAPRSGPSRLVPPAVSRGKSLAVPGFVTEGGLRDAMGRRRAPIRR